VRALTVVSVDMLGALVLVGFGSSLPTADASVNLDGEIKDVKE
jgi:hypothetical protein